jgi:hypothetical protein
MVKPNVQLVRDYFDILAKGNMEALGQLFADDVVWHQPGKGSLSGVYRGKKELFTLLGKFMEISGGSFRIDDIRAIMANENLVTASLHFRAQRKDRQMSMDGVDLMRIESGQIKEVWLFSGDEDAEDDFWSGTGWRS